MDDITRRAALLASLWTAGCVAFQDSVPPPYDYASESPMGSGDGDSAPAGDGDDSTSDDDNGADDGDDSASGDGDDSASGDDDAGVIGEPTDKCDLTGRWLVTYQKVVSAVGALSTIHQWSYLEITKQDGAFKITKGLYCGDDVRGKGLNAYNDTRKYWPVAMVKRDIASRSVSSKQVSAGCDVRFGKIYGILGMSKDYAENPSLALPEKDQQATGGQPGGEDWDSDGKPGITAIVTSNLASGELYTAPRDWNELKGTVADVTAKKIRLSMTWNQETKILGSTNFALETPAGVANDPSRHFAELARLGEDQAVGSDEEKCGDVRMLAPKLTPDAAATTD